LKYETLKFTATRIVQNWRYLILVILAPLLLTGCASAPKVIVEFETIEVEVAVRTELDAELLTDPPGDPCALPPTPQFYFFDLDQWAACLESENDYYARQLKRIRIANKKPPEGG